MIRKRQKRYYRLLLIIPLLICLIGMTCWEKYGDIEKEECVDSLTFKIIGGVVEETIVPFYSEEDNIYYLFLPAYANTGNVQISFKGAQMAVFEDGENRYELKSEKKIQCLEPNKLYNVSMVKGKETQAALRFMLMNSANLPALYIETQSGTMDAVDADKSYQEKGRYVLIDADGALVYADRLDHITSRGNSTWYYPKKSYSIKLEDSADLLNMGSADAWILLSNVEDNTYLRNKITYDMAIEAGMTGAPESRYIDLYINHRYHGMYLLCEKIEAGTERIPIADLQTENKRINKGIEQAERVGTDKWKSVALQNNPRNITGGYILERDVSSKYDFEISGFETDVLEDKYTIKCPEYASVEQTGYIRNLFNGMERAVLSKDGIDPDTGMSYLDYIDVKSFAQKYIIEELCKNNGAGATSSYFYKPEDEVSTKIFAGPVWDYDKAYAKQFGFDSTPRDLCYMTQRGEGTTLFWHLNQHPEFQEAVKECYKEFFSEYITEVIEDRITEYTSQVYASSDMDVIRWKEIYGDTSPYVERWYPIKDFLMERKAFLDEVWLKDAELYTVHFIAPEWDRDTYMSGIKNECFTAIPMLDETDNKVFDGWYTENGELFDMTRPLCEDVTVYAKSHEKQN